MAELNNEDKENLSPVPAATSVGQELDAASKSLSEALRMSFVILKVFMIILVVAFLASGFETVGSDEQAIVLRFGKIRGVGEGRLLDPGAHWIWPYPIDEIVKIPVKTKVNLAINSFWYFQTRDDMLSEAPPRIRPGMGLRPLLDGYCLTRSEEDAETAAGSDGSDYNIVHTKWQLTYQIDDPERFFQSVYVRDITPGDDYFKVITGPDGVKPLLQNLFEDAVVTAMVNYTIDEAISSRKKIPADVERLLQEKLDAIESGIKIESVQLTKSEPPPHTREAFEASTVASQTSQTVVTQAKTDAANTLNEASGIAREKVVDAHAYQTRIRETAKANADYLQRLLPEYKLRPKLIVQKIYLEAMKRIFANAEAKYIVQSAENAKGGEIRVRINRDPLLKRKKRAAPTAETDR